MTSAPAESSHHIPAKHLSALLAALPEYLERQRWFGAKSRKISAVRLLEQYPIPPRSNADSPGCLCVFEVKFTSGPAEWYQLPIATRSPQTAEALPLALILRTEDGTCLCEATMQEDFRSVLLEVIAGKHQIAEVQAHCVPEFLLTTRSPASKVSSAEQSNTSIFFASQFALKLYRRLQPGENPDVEVPRYLAEATSFTHIPQYLGDLRSAYGTLAFLQAFAPNEGDAWAWFGKAIQQQSSDQAVAAASLVGRRTGELHLALSAATDNVDFAAEAFTVTVLAADSSRIHAQMVAALDALKAGFITLPSELQSDASRLLAQRKELLAQANALATANPSRFGKRFRIHGDYHLGQLLRTVDDFLIVDFEGEPAKSIDARRRKDSPLRDVAGMLRSFSYAAASAQRCGVTPVDPAIWEQQCSSAFLSSYRDVFGQHSDGLPSASQFQPMLQAYLLEKSCYELIYELNNRPTWVGIPLKGILSLLDASQGAEPDADA